MPSGFRVNRQGIKKFTRELDKELQTQWRRQHRGMPVRLDEGAGGYGPALSDDHSTHFYGQRGSAYGRTLGIHPSDPQLPDGFLVLDA